MDGTLTYDTTTGKVLIDDVLIGGQTISTENSNQDLKLDPAGTGKVDFITTQQTGVGSAGGATAVPASPTVYAQIKVNGTTYVIPCFAVS